MVHVVFQVFALILQIVPDLHFLLRQTRKFVRNSFNFYHTEADQNFHKQYCNVFEIVNNTINRAICFFLI